MDTERQTWREEGHVWQQSSGFGDEAASWGITRIAINHQNKEERGKEGFYPIVFRGSMVQLTSDLDF